MTPAQQEAVSELRRMVDLRLRLDQAIAAQVATCRHVGDRWDAEPVSWAVIGDALRCSRQAARQKYRPAELFDELQR